MVSVSIQAMRQAPDYHEQKGKRDWYFNKCIIPYVATHPRSDLSELDFGKQAAHFVAEACMVCLAPTYEGYRAHHLAEKAAGYCRMARMCSSIQHEDEYPKFVDAEEALKKEMDEEFQILNEFLEND